MVTIVSHWFSLVPASVWVLLGAALSVAGVQEVVKTFLERQDLKLSEATNVLILTALSSLASGADYLTSAAQTNPSILGTHTVLLVGVTHLLYNFVVKPAIALIDDARTHRAQIKAAEQIDTPAPAAAASVSGDAPV